MTNYRIYNIDGTEYITIKTASKLLKVVKSAVYQYIRLGYLPSIKIEGVILVEFEAVVSRIKALKAKKG